MWFNFFFLYVLLACWSDLTTSPEAMFWFVASYFVVGLILGVIVTILERVVETEIAKRLKEKASP